MIRWLNDNAVPFAIALVFAVVVTAIVAAVLTPGAGCEASRRSWIYECAKHRPVAQSAGDWALVAPSCARRSP